MEKKRRKTTVDLTEIAQDIKNRYVHLGLKNLLSAGLWLFENESPEGKLNAIAEANSPLTDAEKAAREDEAAAAHAAGAQKHKRV